MNNENNNTVQNQEYGQINNNQSQVNTNMYQQAVYATQQTQMVNPYPSKSNNQNYTPNNFVQPVNTKKSKKGLLIAIIISVILALTIALIIILGGSKKSNTRTIMIYMVGSNLESKAGLATVDLEAIEYNPNNNVLLIAGGSSKWNNDFIDNKETSIFELTDSGFKKVQQNSVRNMGDSKVFSDFLDYVYDNYKTDKYDLIFWNHGGAIDGSEYDDNSGDNLSLADMKQGLQNSRFANKKLELVIFRTCLNGTIEVASTLSDYSNYLVASEEVTRGAAWTNVLSFINDIQISDSSIDVGKKFINSYKKQMSDIRNRSIWTDEDSIYSTYSLVDLSKIEDLKMAVNNFFSSIDISKNFNSISKIRNNLRQYGNDVPDYNMVDLYNLVSELKDLSPKNAEQVLNSIDNSIVYNWATSPESRGLSIYFPYNGSNINKGKFLSLYNEFEGFDGYRNFINSFNEIQNSDYTAYSYKFNNATTEAKVDGEDILSDFTLELTDEQIETFASAKYIVYRDNKDGYFKPIYTGGKATLDGNILKASIRDRQLRVISKEDDTKGYTLMSVETENTDKYINYQTFVTLENFRGEIYEWKRDEAVMNILYDKATKKIDILNVLYSDNNLSSSAVVDLSEYDDVLFSISSGWSILDEEGNYIGPQVDENGGVKGDGIITGWEDKPDNFKFVLESFDDDYDYYCIFAIKDTHNNVSYSRLIKMS